jgi:hypothetical protein
MSDIMPSGYSPTADWTDDEWTKLNVWLKGVLLQGPVVVKFTKLNGDERIMTCTLNPELLPPVEIKEVTDKPERKKSDTSIAVYDLTAKAWRSFVTKSVKHIGFSL